MAVVAQQTELRVPDKTLPRGLMLIPAHSVLLDLIRVVGTLQTLCAMFCSAVLDSLLLILNTSSHRLGIMLQELSVLCTHVHLTNTHRTQHVNS